MGRTESSAPTNVYRGFPSGTSYPKGICSAALHCRTPSPTRFYPVISTRVPSLSSTQLS